MAKMKRISINAFEKVVKENYENTVTCEWHGVPITIAKTISLKSVISLVAEVADNCFMEDGTYMPEVMQPLLDCGMIERYTNLSLPSNLEARYELVMRSDIMSVIMAHINTTQYNDIVMAIRDKIDYRCDANVAEFQRAMNHMAKSLDTLQESTKELFGNISADDIRTIVGAVGDERAIEERIVGEYMKQKNANASGLKLVGGE